MREWLTVIVVLLIVGILLDGWRRMRVARQNSIRMSLSMHQGTEKKDLEEFGSELPNGGARVVSQRAPEDVDQLNRSVRESFEASKVTLAKPIPPREPEQVSLNLDEDVPMLMEVDDATASTDADARIEPSLGDESPVPQEVDRTESGGEAADEGAWEFKSTEPAAAREPVSAVEPKVDAAPAEEVLVINVMAPQGHRFAGQALLDIILHCGMRYGAMDIFHHHQGADGDGPVLFSMANMVKPGTFDLNVMDSFETPGVRLFMTLPLASDSLKAFDIMVATAETLCQELGGELKDENRSVMTGQTMEHCRQRIRDFERKQLSRV